LSRLRKGDLFIDIGAWIGWTTLAAAAHGATVMAFEPDPASRAQLKSNIAADQRFDVTGVPIARSDKDGTVQFTAAFELGDSMGSIVRHSRNCESDRAATVQVEDVHRWLPKFEGHGS
jgi:FkbM family methyltransferase